MTAEFGLEIEAAAEWGAGGQPPGGQEPGHPRQKESRPREEAGSPRPLDAWGRRQPGLPTSPGGPVRLHACTPRPLAAKSLSHLRAPWRRRMLPSSSSHTPMLPATPVPAPPLTPAPTAEPASLYPGLPIQSPCIFAHPGGRAPDPGCRDPHSLEFLHTPTPPITTSPAHPPARHTSPARRGGWAVDHFRLAPSIPPPF